MCPKAMPKTLYLNRDVYRINEIFMKNSAHCTVTGELTAIENDNILKGQLKQTPFHDTFLRCYSTSLPVPMKNNYEHFAILCWIVEKDN